MVREVHAPRDEKFHVTEYLHVICSGSRRLDFPGRPKSGSCASIAPH